MGTVKKSKLHSPSLDDIANLLREGLKKTFSVVDVCVVDCPDLREKPFMLAAEGLGGNPRLADVGGVPYLLPLPQKKIYNLREIAQQMNLPDAFIIGAGAGPRHHVGVNCEMMANIHFGADGCNNTHIAKLGKDGGVELMCLKDNEEFCLLGNLYASRGNPGKVLKVIAKQRIDSDNFVSAMRKILASHYKDETVGIGGVFVIRTGKAKLHVMPDYSKTPLNSDEDVNNWLKFFNMDAPLICLSSFVSQDPGLDLRVEHTHCFSDHGQGGHYHEDTTPDLVEYEGYFNVAEYMYRFDQPVVMH